MTKNDAYSVPEIDDKSAWKAVPIKLDEVSIDPRDVQELRIDILEYACLETFGMTPEDSREEEDIELEDHIELSFIKAVRIENVTITVWSFKDDQSTWVNAFIGEGSWDRPPLRTKGGFITIEEGEELSADQFAWRFFHRNIAEPIDAS